MTGIVSSVRYERKWLPTGLSMAEVLALVRRHPAAFRPAYPERQVNNVYFDTPRLDHYFDHISGASERVKVRLRWYGDFNDFGASPALELKFKRGSASWKESFPWRGAPPRVTRTSGPPGWKQSFPWPGARLEEVLSHTHAQDGWQEEIDLPEAVRLRLRSLQPTLANRYHRHYFRSAGDGIRLTVDSSLSFFGVSASSRGLQRLACDGPTVVLELKYRDSQTAAAAQMAGGFPFRVRRCSKYVLGIQHLDNR
ncbi:MAG: polyphosphate polymerase domain-containing protein [Chloroflexi bacterium]|nr:polyphosphate polymerase domain-containing protein [Chloroflexota bacterium]